MESLSTTQRLLETFSTYISERMRSTFWLFCFLTLSLNSRAEVIGEQWFDDYEKAVAAAKEKKRPILMYFSGSDWCKPCIMLTQTIFQTERFQQFSRDSLVLLHLDFPRRKENLPPAEIVAAREALAEKYNTSGAFPHVVLLTPESTVIGSTGYKAVSPDEYVTHLKLLLKTFVFGNVPDGLPTETGLLRHFRKDSVLMTSHFEISALTGDDDLGHRAILAAYDEIGRIEKLISEWDPNSQTSAINANAGIKPVVVDLELFQLIRRSVKVSEITDGAFDISFAAIDKHWKFDMSMTALPDSAQLKKSVAKINYRNIILNEAEHSVFLKEEGMKIGFGGIGQGYAVNMARKLMISMGIDDGMVNSSGDIVAWGNGVNGRPWRIGIADPNKEKPYIAYLEIKEMAVVTSGDYERYSVIDGVRYAHIIDPKTGYPCRGLKSVTIVCADVEIADALATGVFVLGQEKGLALIEKMAGVDCILVNDKDEIITTPNLELSYFE